VRLPYISALLRVAPRARQLSEFKVRTMRSCLTLRACCMIVWNIGARLMSPNSSIESILFSLFLPVKLGTFWSNSEISRAKCLTTPSNYSRESVNSKSSLLLTSLSILIKADSLCVSVSRALFTAVKILTFFLGSFKTSTLFFLMIKSDIALVTARSKSRAPMLL